MQSINIMGGGRVGQTLGRLLTQSTGYRVQAVLTRQASSAQAAVDFIGAGQAHTELQTMPAADLWMLAVPDGQIAPMAAALAELDGLPPGLAFHCSGALCASELQALRDKGWQVASAHCLLSFAQPATALGQFAGTPCALEGDAQALPVLRTLFTQLGAACFELASADKLLYHAGAVFATNFLPVLQDLAERLWQHANMPPELARQMRATLLTNAVNNIVQLGPQAALTGPAARGDRTLVAQQAQAVTDWDAQAGAAYKALSELAQQLAQCHCP
ncbi:MAG: hypothetical protein FD135_3173 [Comamonadaceae bacterium]|nr:MAG: hypothetical protein FD135_3173 [Comamonadaceae bacterium]